MFNDLLGNSANTILVNRLNRISQNIINSTYPTEEEYQAAIYTAVNEVIQLGNSMAELIPIIANTPAIVGDVATNFININNDAKDILAELLAFETDASRLFNLGEASQNTIRQTIRELIYYNTNSYFTEAFINGNNFTTTATADFGAARLTLPISKSTQLVPNISLGVNCIGTSLTQVNELTSGGPTPLYTWNGSQINVVFTFNSPAIVNRLVIVLDDYGSYNLSRLISTPDGTIYNDILQSLGVTNISIDPSSNKYSGSVIIDFPPQQVSSLQLILQDVSNLGVLNLRGIQLWQISYSNSAVLTSKQLSIAPNTYTFNTIDLSSPDLTAINYQISQDGNNFTTISPGSTVSLSNPFWYKILLTRTSQGFSKQSNAYLKTSGDPSSSTDYTIVSSSSVSLGSNITERTINLSSITGPVVLNETPLNKTLTIQAGSMILNTTSGYTFSNNTINFDSNQSAVTITYQVSSLSSVNIQQLENYYTPFVNQITFEE